MKIIIIAIVFLVGMPFKSIAQIYQKQGRNRYTFAQTTIGYDLEFTPASGFSYQYNANGVLEKYRFGTNLTPIITITGLHFWGRAEFFTGFSLPSIGSSNNSNVLFRRYAGTGAKIFLLPIKDHAFRPYIGSAIAGFEFRKENGPTYKRVQYPVLLGLTYSFNHGLLEIGASYYLSKNKVYPISKTEFVPFSPPRLSFNIDYKYYFDFSISSFRRDASGDTQKTYDQLKSKKKLNSISLALGPAYSFIIGRSSYNKAVRPYLDDYRITKLYPDIGIGYYHYNMDASINFSYRSYTAKLNAFDVQQSVLRRSLSLEAYKFFLDYHGFVPFAGAIVSYEYMRFHEFENHLSIHDRSKTFLTPGIILGWDIRPTRVEWWGIRTNIRYFPFLQMKLLSDYTIDLQQIELNFLQFVFYPNRFYGYLNKD